MRQFLSHLSSGLLLTIFISMAAGCSSVASHTTDKTASSAFGKSETSYLGKTVDEFASGQGGKSGFLLMDRGRDALSWRLILADAAEKSIDAQYFLWKNDEAGKVMIHRLLAAADRGVRVRVMIDDSMTDSDPGYLALFGAHPNVELRLYKPFGPKHKSMVVRWIDYVADMRVLNRRMHNKLYVVDGSVAVVGGRNIGNEYFEYPGAFVNRSRDLLALGPVVNTTGDAFDMYWNSDWTVPIEQVVTPVPTQQQFEVMRESLNKIAGLTSSYPPGFYDEPKKINAEMAELKDKLLWGKASLLVDTVPELNGKPQTHAELDHTGVIIGRLAEESSEEILIQSAYLVLLDSGFKALTGAKERGVKVKLATNSMASNNHLSVFVGYRKQRKKLLNTGAELYEMRPDAKSERAVFTEAQLTQHKTLFGLHAKTVVFDRKYTFVGSFNVDPRSVNLNTEMGLLVESTALARVVAESIENDMAAGNSWQVILKNDNSIEWITTDNGVVISELDKEPMTSKGQRAEADLLTIIPDDSQL
ncbi:MAG: phospholipase D family protein [Gammaproteobacteria bacterium]|nr:MAG: phospholipase D family protein [Gammaproteobacteria bacterium]